MKLDKKRKTLQDTLSSIDGALAALNAYPSLEDALLARGQATAGKILGQFFPTQLDFSKEILEHLVGTDVLIDIISEFLTTALPGVEIAIKSAILANMQNFGTNCLIDPIIYEKAVREGVTFDLRQIDLTDKLTISPLDRKLGRYFYFGIEDCESAYDVLQSVISPDESSTLGSLVNNSVGHYNGGKKRDFDCLLWYMKNKAAYREVWDKKTIEVKTEAENNEEDKYTKKFGILTLEYNARSGNVLQSDGNPMLQQTPYDNVLHVFVGNVKELSTDSRDKVISDWEESSNINKLGNQILKRMKLIQENHVTQWEQRREEWQKIGEGYDKLMGVEYNSALKRLNRMATGNDSTINGALTTDHELYNDISGLTAKLNAIKEIIETYYGVSQPEDTTIELPLKEFDFSVFMMFDSKMNDELGGYSIQAYVNRVAQIMDANESMVYFSAKDMKYPEAKQNYYFKRTLFEFNTDYVTSLQLFDSKVLAAQLITSLFSGLSTTVMLGITPSWKTQLIQDTVRDMVEKVIAAEDFAVSDCFFTFSNDAYNSMLNATDLRQAGIRSQRGEGNEGRDIDIAKILGGLNGIDTSADQAGQVSIIKGVITTAAGEICKDSYSSKNNFAVGANLGVDKSFIEALLLNLCTQLVMAVLSPKVYLLILINLEMFGLSTNFDLKAFIKRFENLIRSIVKSVVDQFMQYLANKIIGLIEDLVQKLISKLAFEQAEMYARLLKQILMHLRLFSNCNDGTMGWTQDIIGYADIASGDSQEPINEC